MPFFLAIVVLVCLFLSLPERVLLLEMLPIKTGWGLSLFFFGGEHLVTLVELLPLRLCKTEQKEFHPRNLLPRFFFSPCCFPPALKISVCVEAHNSIQRFWSCWKECDGLGVIFWGASGPVGSKILELSCRKRKGLVFYPCSLMKGTEVLNSEGFQLFPCSSFGIYPSVFLVL